MLERLEAILGFFGTQGEVLGQLKKDLEKSKNAKIGEGLDSQFSSDNSQDLIFAAMSPLQFQDIIRQKIEKLATKPEDLLDSIGTTVGRDGGAKKKRAHSLTIEQAGLVPDGRKDAIDAILAEHLAGRKQMEPKQGGKVIGQLTNINRQSEQGASEAMGHLEKSMAAVETLQSGRK